jgi:hypothetical protein
MSKSNVILIPKKINNNARSFFEEWFAIFSKFVNSKMLAFLNFKNWQWILLLGIVFSVLLNRLNVHQFSSRNSTQEQERAKSAEATAWNSEIELEKKTREQNQAIAGQAQQLNLLERQMKEIVEQCKRKLDGDQHKHDIEERWSRELKDAKANFQIRADQQNAEIQRLSRALEDFEKRADSKHKKWND